MKDTMTGIPIDVLFTVIIALIGAVYADIKRELRSLRRNGTNRDLLMERFRIALSYVCQTLHVPFAASLLDGKTPQDDDSGEHKIL